MPVPRDAFLQMQTQFERSVLSQLEHEDSQRLRSSIPWSTTETSVALSVPLPTGDLDERTIAEAVKAFLAGHWWPRFRFYLENQRDLGAVILHFQTALNDKSRLL